ncbi:hypothetical protein NLJ89_g5564 [Agrocybe chaxingu]|uniref:Uncharacterized protein n=1 Tax=Agrocybe chaxingu TaxID=84603 RepID=A0A9W8MTH6_9AGAR|nr:hypothetical protein NLJ89_g5564 [Agrocybe chaxingu]
MEAAQQAPCINSEPDVAGIGVRLAIFIQIFLAFLPPILAISDGKVTPSEAKRMFRLSIQSLAFAACLIFVATIKLAQASLSAYHTLTIVHMTWALEGPLVLSYPLVGSVLLALWKGAQGVDILGKTSMTLYLPLFRLFHGIFALVVWSLITAGESWLKCIDETFLLPGLKLTIKKRAVQGFFIFLSTIRILEALLAVLRRFNRQGAGGSTLGEGADEKVHRGVVMPRLSLAAILCAWLFVFSWRLGKESVNIKLVAPGEISWGFGQIIPLCMLVSQVWEVYCTFWIWMRPVPNKPNRSGGDSEDVNLEVVPPEIRQPLEDTPHPLNSKEDEALGEDGGRSTAVATKQDTRVRVDISDSESDGEMINPPIKLALLASESMGA